MAPSTKTPPCESPTGHPAASPTMPKDREAAIAKPVMNRPISAKARIGQAAVMPVSSRNGITNPWNNWS